MLSFLKTPVALITGKFRLAAFDSGSAVVLINATTVTKWIGINRMTLHRWVNGRHEADRKYGPLPDFPAPIVIHGRRYWRKNDILKFISDRASAA